MFLIATMIGAPISTSEAQAGPARFTPFNFQERLNVIARTRKGPAAQVAIISAYRQFARSNPNQAFTLVRMATVRLDSVTPPAQRAAAIVRLSQAASSAFIGMRINDRSLIIATFTYLVSSVPPDFRDPAFIQTITQHAVKASVDTGGTQQERAEIVKAFGGSATGPDFSKSESTAIIPTSVQGHAQFFSASAPAAMGLQACQLTTGRVTAYSVDGTVIARGTLSPSGSFVLSDTDERISSPGSAAGLLGSEIRIVIELPNGSTLMADSERRESFVQVSLLTTIMAQARKNRPDLNLTLVQAEAALRSYFRLSATLSLEDFGGETTAFSEVAFWEAARSWNRKNNLPVEDIDFVVENVEDGVQEHAAGRLATIGPVQTALAAKSLLGVGDDNADSIGSLDPDQHFSLASDGGIFDPNTNGYEKASNLGLANSIVSNVCSSIQGVVGFVLLFDIDEHTGEKHNGISKLAKWAAGIGFATIGVQFVVELFLDIFADQAPDPVQEGLAIISNQIAALSDQLAQTEAKILFAFELARTQEPYERVLGRWNDVKTLRPTSPDPQNANQFQLHSRDFAANPQGAQASIALANSMLGINGSQNGVSLFNRMVTGGLGMSAANSANRMDLPIRSNALILQARNIPMRYVNMLTSALQVTAEESRVFMNLNESPAHRLTTLQESFVEATPAFGSNGLAALRRRGLQQAPTRFSSSEILVDSTRGESGRGLIWSTEVMVRALDNTVVRWSKYDRNTRYIDGDKFKPGSYRLNDELPAGIGWRLPTLQELQSLPGWGKGDAGLEALATKAGIVPAAGHWFAVLDPLAPDVIVVNKDDGGEAIQQSQTTGKVRFYSFHNGSEVTGIEATRNLRDPDTLNCLRVFDLNTFPGNAEVPTVRIDGRLASGLFAWPDTSGRKPLWWPKKAYYSSIMRSAGIPPTNIIVLDQLIPNPWYSATPNDPREVPTHLKVLNALAYWSLKGSDSESRGFVEDVSGLVEWQSSDPTAAVVGNVFSRFDSAADAAEPNRFVSPWFSTITFSKVDVPVTFTAKWVQGLLTASPANQVTITQAADVRLCVPPVASGLDVTPGHLLYTTATQINGVSMAATRYLTDRSAEDATNGVQWALLEVTKEGDNEVTTPFNAELATISQGSNGRTGGVLSVQAGAGIPARTLRVLATDPTSGRTGKADLRLQF